MKPCEIFAIYVSTIHLVLLVYKQNYEISPFRFATVEMTCWSIPTSLVLWREAFCSSNFYRIKKLNFESKSWVFYYYLWFESPNLFKKWNIKLNTTATILARTIPFNCIPKKLIEIPLSPVTNTIEVKIKFWLFE